MEIAVDQSSGGGIEETRRAIAAVGDVLGGEMLVGGGTILTPAQVRAVGSAGARFVLMPNTDPNVIAEAGALGLAAIPGALTPTECVGAMAAGADIVKLFPAGRLGPSYVRALRAPLPHIPLLAVGGVDLSNVREFLDCGMVGAGIGASLVSAKQLAERDYKGISQRPAALTTRTPQLRRFSAAAAQGKRGIGMGKYITQSIPAQRTPHHSSDSTRNRMARGTKQWACGIRR
jgi:2-dehydro-3-deoxyphosphogluconate aldolase/(4S)-4-hydroxy-2-oxoglutarate aldolase